jgi:hypothetical protein
MSLFPSGIGLSCRASGTEVPHCGYRDTDTYPEPLREQQVFQRELQ